MEVIKNMNMKMMNMKMMLYIQQQMVKDGRLTDLVGPEALAEFKTAKVIFPHN